MEREEEMGGNGQIMRKWRENEQMERKLRGNGQIMRKWREIHSPSLSIHFLYQKLSHFVAN